MTDDDLTPILRNWPYVSGEVNVRLIQAGDGRMIIQMRVDLGILQMETSGRPDGTRPDGFESLLEACAAALQKHVDEHDDAEGFMLTSDHCRRLREEAIQYYHRYVSLLALEEYDGVMRDTEHNMHIIEFCREFGETEFDQTVMEQLRCNTLMMHARAEASQAVAAKDTRAALAAIDRGLEAIREALETQDVEEEEAFDSSAEVQLLRSMREALVPKLPVSQRSELHDRLKAALAAENYELAAILRDELRLLRDE
ncbi:MAG: UvrB/UvrC motif-containing protein [Phycisphaerales bacterium]|nr:UvrB/UvrC motif-containing protein [Phycisphaerales bacterium]